MLNLLQKVKIINNKKHVLCGVVFINIYNYIYNKIIVYYGLL